MSARGGLVEERLTIGDTICRRLRAGQSVSSGTSHVHRVRGVYAVSDEGALQRESVAPTDDLRSAPASAQI